MAATRYARAVLDLAQADNALDRWQADLATLQALVAEPSVGAYLASTRVPEAEKAALLHQALAGAHPQTLNLARLLVRKHRTALVPDLVAAFQDLVDGVRAVVRAQITTAVPLTDDGRTAIRQAVQRRTGASAVDLQEQVDRDLLGGAVIRIGDHLIDGSVRTRLRGLRRSIAGTVQ